MLRAAKSVLKLVAAAARLSGRDVASAEDVELAFDIFEEKMKFLSAIEPTFAHIKEWRNSTQAKEQRATRIREHFAGRSVRIAEVTVLFPGLSQKTIARDLHGIGARPDGDGRWDIPSA